MAGRLNSNEAMARVRAVLTMGLDGVGWDLLRGAFAETGQGRWDIGPQVANLPHKAVVWWR
jgi:hypothetical protein